ncbi:hypothetical protein [Xanthomonas sp. NCPPB 2632]|uniref:hypothetical protein n=1 Tax=Xanthomonas sp. NCPPB 2632 TaxID=3240912 RepID=UPI003512950F
MKVILPGLSMVILASVFTEPVNAQNSFGGRVDGTLCTSDETVMFACDLKMKKVAVCARKAGNEAFASLQYRFGTTNWLDLSFPAANTYPASIASGASRGDMSRGSMVFLRMTNRETSYTVYHVTASPSNTGQGALDAGGILVERNGKLLAKRVCDSKQRIYSGMLDDPDFFGKAVPVDTKPVATFSQFGHRADSQ